MNQIERALRDGIRVEGGERLGWCAWDELLGCYHNKHNNAREAIRWARECRTRSIEDQRDEWRAGFARLLTQTQEKYDVRHHHAASDAAAG